MLPVDVDDVGFVRGCDMHGYMPGYSDAVSAFVGLRGKLKYFFHETIRYVRYTIALV